MTCTLILSRHAKSAWNTNAPSDHARPLSTRGRRSAAALGDWLRDQHIQPNQILCSSSLRTRQTVELMALSGAATYTERLYHATAQVILDVLRRADAPKVMVMGHNPGLAEFAHQIVKHAPAHSRFEDYPTGATLVVEFEIERWSKLQPGTGRAIDFVVPRELLGDCRPCTNTSRWAGM